MPKRKGDRAVTLVDPLTRYLQQVQTYPLLTEEEEHQLATRYREYKDLEAAKKLILAHLRLVVKIALEYRQAYHQALDLIGEGSVGLMTALQRFDPERGIRFSTYAAWWIRSYILKFILDNFRLIRVGTTKEQRKLFYNLMKEKRKIENLGYYAGSRLLAEKMKVSPEAVEEMTQRLSQPEIGLSTPVGEEGGAILEDFIPIKDVGAEEKLAKKEATDILQEKLQEFAFQLKPRELKIFHERLLAEVPRTLQTIADEYHISKERVRQIEEHLLKRLKNFFDQVGLKVDILQAYE